MTAMQWASLILLGLVVGGIYLPLLAPMLQDPRTRERLWGYMRHAVLAGAILFAASQFYTRPTKGTPALPPVTAALKSASAADKAKVRAIYGSLADVTQRDAGKLITTTAVWRAIHADALRLAVGGTDLVGKYPGLDKSVEEVLSTHFSLDNKPLDKPQVDAIVAGCKEVERQSE